MLFPTLDAQELQRLSHQLHQRTNKLQQSRRQLSVPPASTTRTKFAAYALAAAVAASWLGSALKLLATHARWTDVLLAYLSLELTFFAWQYRRYRIANQVVHDPPNLPPGLDRTVTITDYLLSHDVPLQEFVEGWFHGAPLEQIKRGNMIEFLAYGIFYTQYLALSGEEQQLLLDLLTYVEGKLGLTFQEGYNRKLRFMAHLWQPLRAVHLPLCVYAVTEGIGLVADAALFALGFRPAGTIDGFRYWTTGRCHISDTTHPQQQPVLFLHGVLGLVGCVPLLARLRKSLPGRPMVVLDIRHVSMRLTLRGARTVDEVAAAAVAALRREGMPAAHVIAHSYGTFVAARLLKSEPLMVASLVLMEPVALLTCWPTLLSTFVYGQPVLEPPTSIKAIVGNLRWLCSREQTMAETFCRRFYWSELTIWPQELPEASLLVLSGQDDLVAAKLVEKLCRKVGKGSLLCRHDGVHGDVLLHRQWQEVVVAEIVDVVAKGKLVD